MAKWFENSEPVTLGQVLGAREHRAETQRKLLAKYEGCSLVSFTLNIPGKYKVFPLAEKTFERGCALIAERLDICGYAVSEQMENRDPAGYEGFFLVEDQAERVKKALILLEEGHALGRLFDIDVLDRQGRAVKGAELGRQARRCLMCDRSAWECSRLKVHSIVDLASCAAEIMSDYFLAEATDRIASAAVQALICEVGVTPKPGLVDRHNNGAHKDMDFFTFIDSAEALRSYFRDIARIGMGLQNWSRDHLPLMRYRGILAERNMFKATGGVNTHKGSIFSLGLLSAAMGYMHSQGIKKTPRELLELCGELSSKMPSELADKSGTTHGMKAYQVHGAAGARGEAAAGYPTVMDTGYPTLVSLCRQGWSLNDSGVAVLLKLMAQVEDTNIIHRAGMDALHEIQVDIAAFLSQSPSREQVLAYARKLDSELIERNISPGGSADLLAVCFMLYFIFEETAIKSK